MRSSTKIRTGIIGTGKIAGLDATSENPSAAPTCHAQALAESDTFEWVAAHDPDPARLSRFTRQWKVPQAYTDLRQLLASDPLDLIIICGPDLTHFETLKQVLTANPPRLLLIEKPICVAPSELTLLSGLSERFPETRIALNHSRRFDDLHRQVRDIILRNELGNPVLAQWTYYGGWIHNGIHVADTLRMLFADEFHCVSAVEVYPGPPGDPCIDAELVALGRSGLRVKLIGFPETSYQLFEAELHFTEGRIRLLNFGDEVFVDRVKTNSWGERELDSGHRLSAIGGASRFKALYGAIAGFFNGDETALDQVGFPEVRRTMNLLFDVKAKNNDI